MSANKNQYVETLKKDFEEFAEDFEGSKKEAYQNWMFHQLSTMLTAMDSLSKSNTNLAKMMRRLR